MSDSNKFIFNREFFFTDEDATKLKKNHPHVWFAFHDNEAGPLFFEIDQSSKSAKTAFRIAGLAAVGMAWIALVLAAAEPILILPLVNSGPQDSVWKFFALAVAGLAAIMGVASFVISFFGLGTGRRKTDWLCNRLVCERLRQWQGQYLTAKFTQIVEAARTGEGISAYRTQRKRDFALFKDRFVTNSVAQLSRHLAVDKLDPQDQIWIHSELIPSAQSRRDIALCEKNINELDKLTVGDFFRAYEAIRFNGQIEYSEYKSEDLGLSAHSKTQERWLSGFGKAMIVFIAVLHVGVLIGVFGGPSWLKGPEVHFLAIVAALTGLAIRVLEDGLAPSQEVARLEAYLDDIRSAHQKFVAASDFSEKLESMHQFEEAAAREMLSFLRTTNSSRFIL
ncbi:MAG: hypothetical protein AAFS07_07790 [Pseudomonadota bacterium]